MSDDVGGVWGGVRPAGAAGSAWPDEVARYYDRNTRRFLWVGRGAHSMHRELWGPGVRSSREAVDHIHTVLANEVDSVVAGSAPTVVDFGCGVGGTLFHLARRFPYARLAGITVSARQTGIAERLARELDLADRCSFATGDFQSADLGVRADVVVAVESFVHSDRPSAFLANAVGHLKPGGSLIVVDDFLASDELDARSRLLVDQFKSGWRVPAVCSAERLVASATEHGLEAVEVADLTALTRPGSRKRDRVLGVVSPLLARLGLGRIPFYGNMIGGNALQIGLREGFLRYQMVVLRRVA